MNLDSITASPANAMNLSSVPNWYNISQWHCCMGCPNRQQWHCDTGNWDGGVPIHERGAFRIHCSVGQIMFPDSDPRLCNFETSDGGGVFTSRNSNVYIGGAILIEKVCSISYLTSVKVVKSYYRINSDPRKWRERTVLLGKNIMSNVDADPIPGSSISRPPLNFTAGDTPVSIDSMMLAHLLFLAGSPDVELVGSYTIGRIFSTTSISIWLVVAILLPASLYIAVHCWFKDLERAMGHSWNCVMSSAMHGRCYQGPPLKIMLRAYSDDDVDVMMGDSVLRAINDDESSRDLVRLESIKDD
ncbi:hypothetical protein BC939DRAFT_453358, partial [Gamsiella multidivaricata]|uniref:uncharacterized protein n=1 Tax=Gamsiella multidivaricata TaxID=101098 RepID=UPI0022209097